MGIPLRTQETCTQCYNMGAVSGFDPARLVSSPVVSRRQLVAIIDPTLHGSERAKFQTLVDKRVVSRGVRRPIRAGGRLRGSIRVFSSVNRTAVRLYREGRQSEAQSVAKQAARLEARRDFAEVVSLLATFASQNDAALRAVAEIPWQAVRVLEMSNLATQQLLASTASAAAAVAASHAAAIDNLSRVAGWVQTVDRNMAYIATVSGALAQLPLPQLKAVGLDRIGSAVEVEWEELAGDKVIVTTAGAIGSIGVKPETERWTVFNPPTVIRASPKRWAMLQTILDREPIAIPSIPIVDALEET